MLPDRHDNNVQRRALVWGLLIWFASTAIAVLVGTWTTIFLLMGLACASLGPIFRRLIGASREQTVAVVVLMLGPGLILDLIALWFMSGRPTLDGEADFTWAALVIWCHAAAGAGTIWEGRTRPTQRVSRIHGAL